MKAFGIALLALTASLRCVAMADPSPSTAVKIAGGSGVDHAKMEQRFGAALSAVSDWWRAHEMGFPEYKMRSPQTSWQIGPCANPRNRGTICLYELGRDPTQGAWYAECSTNSTSVFHIGAPEGPGYSITWMVLVSDKHTEISEVRIDKPVLPWVDTSSLR